MKNVTAILGSADPEMGLIEVALTAAGVRYVYASVDGCRVHPGNAGRATGVIGEIGSGQVVLVECDGPWLRSLPVVARCDHHSPGDQGFGRPPEEFLTASSVGQVMLWLAGLPTDGTVGIEHSGGAWFIGGQVVPADVVLGAAADHCLGAAYAGRCPGVDPDALMLWRAQSRAEFQGRSVKSLLADIAQTQAALDSAAMVNLSAVAQAADMRREPPWPELPEAAARLGAGYISGPLIGPDGRRKFTCSGLPEQVKAFMDEWAPKNGLTGIYGDPKRGFAGGYAA